MKKHIDLISGTAKAHNKYSFERLTKLVGKTIIAVAASTVENANGEEPSTIIYFNDKTYHEFVHPSEY